MNAFRQWTAEHPDTWQFRKFNALSGCATLTNFVVMWFCTGFAFRAYAQQPFQFLIFHYTQVKSDLGLCGFLSFLVATAAAQTVNFFVQKNLVFRSKAAFRQAVPGYLLLSVVLVLLSAALPAYSQVMFVHIGVSAELAPTLANLVNIVLQVAISYPAMKFCIMKDNGKA